VQSIPVERGRRWRRLTPVVLALGFLCLFAHFQQGDARASDAAETCPPGARSSHSASLSSVAALTGQLAPTQIVACIGARSITEATVAHWASVARKSEGPSPKHPATPREVIKEVMGFLISSDWVLDEAHALHIHASGSEVRRTFSRIRASQFPKRGEFQAFVKRSGQTVADLMLRVELNLLSARIQKRVVAGHHSQASKELALKHFVKRFKRKWRARTYCVPKYAAADCGHVQGPPL
jgi:hypothetical protein